MPRSPESPISSSPALAPDAPSPANDRALTEARLHAPQLRRRLLGRLTRITSSGNYVPEIDGLRFIAIAAVVMYHIANHVTVRTHLPEPRLLEMASHGVELFFVISGFVLALPFADRYLCGGPKVSLGRYLLRRVTRLEPPYLAALLLVLMLKLMASAEAPPMNELLPRLAASAGYVHGAIFGTPSPIIGPAWSLEIEVQFYLLMPGLAWVFLIRHRGLRRGIIVAAGVAIALVQPIRLDSLSGNPSMERHLLNYLQFFLAGILLADVYLVDWNRRPAAAWWGDIIWLVGWPLLAWLLVSDPGSTVGATFSLRRTFIGFPAIVFILYAAMFRARGARACMSIPVLTVIGGMCYSIYLVHNSLIFIAGVVLLTKFPRAFEGGYLTSLLWCSGAMIPTVLLGSTLFFVLIERPCMRRDWPQRLRDLIFVEVKETA